MGEDRLELAKLRARPWEQYKPTYIECDFDPCADIEAALDAANEGDFIVAVMPREIPVMRRLRGGWVVVNEYLEDDAGNIVIVRKGEPTSEKMRFYFPYVWQIGDSYVLVPLVELLRKKYPGVEIFFEYDVSNIIEGTVQVNDDVAKKMVFDGIYHHDTAKSPFASYFRWNEHFYLHDIRNAGRMGWVPEDYEWEGKPPALKTNPEDDAWAREQVQGEYVVVNPKAAFYIRDLPLDRWKRVIQFLDDNGYTTVVVGKDEFDHKLRDHEYRNVINLSGKTTFGQVYSLIKSARLMLTPDTGLMHFACTTGIPTIAVYGPSVPSLVTLPPVKPVARVDGGCVECYGDMVFHALCDGRADCMKAITTNQVVEATAEELGISVQTVPEVSVCLMVLNERKTLPDCLDSLRGLADEIVVVDTGSTDGTVEYLQGRDDVTKIIHEKIPESGIEDFSYYRNIAFANATKKYAMWIDACERVKDPVAVKSQIVKGLSDVYYMTIHHGSITYNREKIGLRMFAEFIDPIHETMLVDGLKSSLFPPEQGIDRVVFKKVGREDSKSRNLRILRKLIRTKPADHPSRPRWLYYLGRDLNDMGRYQEAMHYLRDRIYLHGWYQERVAACVLLARYYLYESKEYQKADNVAEVIKSISDAYREYPYIKGESLYWRERYLAAKDWYIKALSIPRPIQSMWLWEPVYTWLPYDRLSRICELTGNIDGAIMYARQQYHLVDSSEKAWLNERIKGLSGMSDFVGAGVAI